MNFNSTQFLFFLPIFLALYGAVFRRERLRDLLLLCASYFFYMCWSVEYGALLLLSTTLDYLIARGMAATSDCKARKGLLILSLVINLGILGIFKYSSFALALMAKAASPLGLRIDSLHFELVLPIAISFYTFHELSYIIDVYRREIPVETSFIKYASFVAFFPQLVAGPILRASHFLPQLHRTPLVDEARFNTGLALVFRGLFKKIVIADLLATLAVDAIFAAPQMYSSWDLLLGLYGYSFQIYNDFSGYSDIAIGLARMLGFDLPANFKRPYLALGIREFWSRWHISLSTWLRDYLYIPLGGNRGTPAQVKRNLMLTMLIGGLWHGAALNFVFWGGWHGLLLCLARNEPVTTTSLPVRLGRWFISFHLVVFSWLLFRISDWKGLVAYSAGLLRLSGGTVLHPLYDVVLALAALSHFTPKTAVDHAAASWAALPAPVQGCAYALLLLFFGGVTVGSPAFIYFQF